MNNYEEQIKELKEQIAKLEAELKKQRLRDGNQNTIIYIGI